MAVAAQVPSLGREKLDMKSAGSSISFKNASLLYLLALLFVVTVAVSAIAPKEISLEPYGPSPNPYQAAR